MAYCAEGLMAGGAIAMTQERCVMAIAPYGFLRSNADINDFHPPR